VGQAASTAGETQDGRQGPLSAKGERTRARLLTAAKQVFEQAGFVNARIVDIAETADLATSAFYHYFDSKEQVFREVAAAQEQRLTAPPDGSEELVPDSGFVRIRAAIRGYLERYRAEAALMGVIEQVSRYDGEVNAARMATTKLLSERAERSLRRAQESEIVDSRVDPVMAADMLSAMVTRFAELWLVQGYRDYDLDEVVDQLTLLWTNALGMAAPSPRPSP
jgi:AcrR family transcriptional regulator